MSSSGPHMGIYDFQCDDCGRRFPRQSQLNRHIRISHESTGTVSCRWCPYTKSSSEAYRVRKRELIHQKYLRLIPEQTPQRQEQLKSAVYVNKPQATTTSTTGPWDTDTTRQLTQMLDESMPDFADLLRMEPRTPSPMRQLCEPEVHLPEDVAIRSDQLFSRYLPTSPVSSAESHFTSESPAPVSPPSNHPLVSESEAMNLSFVSSMSARESVWPTTPVLPTTSVSLATSVSPAILALPSPISSVSPLSSTSQLTCMAIYLSVRTSAPISTSFSITPSSVTLTTDNQQQPPDLTTRKPETRIIPTTSLTAEIDCTKPSNIWKKTVPITIDNPKKIYEHCCLDPRTFFAGAPSSYLKHPLAKTLQHQVNLCRSRQKCNYTIHLTPLGTKTIMKEERCTFPDGTILELRDTWTSSTITEE